MNGLNDKDVIINREKYGVNILSKKKKDSFIKLFIETFSDPIIKILLIALGIKIVFLFKEFNWFETIGIVISILIASLVSSISEYGSMMAFDKLTDMYDDEVVKVIRNGKIKNINIKDIVVNDLVKITSGDRIPADGVIISGNISLDESLLNGESSEVYKSIDDSVYMSTVVYHGDGIVKITSVGDNTFYGKLASELQNGEVVTPLKLRLSKLAKDISKIGYICAFLVIISYLFYMIVINNNFNINSIVNTLKDYRLIFKYFLDALTLGVTIIVVSVPEGLPMMITLVLSSNMKRMLKDNVLVRKLEGIETAGNINILFSDKTGTITKGNLEVVGLYSGGFQEIDKLYSNKDIYNLFIMGCVINNESIISNGEVVGGNITDKALIKYFGDVLFEYNVLKKDNFDSKKKYMSSKIECFNHKYNVIKGAYEEVLKLCDSYYDKDGNIHLIDKKYIDDKIKLFSLNMNRVIAIGINIDRELLNKMTLVGFVILTDEVREGVKEGIELVNKAHIHTIMITGDNRETAISIGKEIGLINDSDDIVINGDKLRVMSDDDIRNNLNNIKIISRAMPQDKSRLVEIAQSMGLCVGMTGDGVNDAIALKKSDVGFAMGSGTEVAKEASDIVILDNNFYSIMNAILYGRTIFKSIRKFIICQLTINLCSLFITIIGPFIGVPVPITVIQMLWINMIMDTLSGLAFSYEPALKEYMYEDSKNKNESIINKYMFNQILVTGICSFLICIIFLKSKIINYIYGDNLMSGFFGLIIFISIFNSFDARTYRLNIFSNLLKNKVFIFVIMFVSCMQIFLIYYGGELFRTNGLTFTQFIIMFFMALLIIPIDFIRKCILKKKGYKLGV